MSASLPYPVVPYLEARERWPKEGAVILAHHDDTSIVVYQAYRKEIGIPAAASGRFVEPWSRSRMTWIKPNFLWMMYRCGWATKGGQEVVLALRLQRSGFDAIVRAAVPSSFDPERYPSHDAWQAAVHASDVRLQWDPDHDPSGARQVRRAIQLGLRGAALARFADEWIQAIDDVTPFVREQHANLEARGPSALLVPDERPYVVSPA